MLLLRYSSEKARRIATVLHQMAECVHVSGASVSKRGLKSIDKRGTETTLS